jgi:DNA-binding transcriptional ArsR family regulator
MNPQLPMDLFRTLGDATRRGLYERLSREGELSVGALTERAGVSQPAVSQHLRALKNAGLVAEQKRGRQVLYRADAAGLRPLIDWVAFYGSFWVDRIDRLEQLLKEMDQ